MQSPVLSRNAPTLGRAVRRASRKGMSLVEIMVVIAIIGVLMTVVAVNVVGFLDDANVDATVVQIKNMEKGILSYYAKKGRYPAALEDAKKYFTDNQVPTDAWGNPFQYRMPGTQGDYDIISYGKDGKEGGTEANADITNHGIVGEEE